MNAVTRRMVTLTALGAVCGVAALALIERDATSLESAESPQDLSAALVENDGALREGIDAWRAAGDPPSEPPPAELMAQAQYLQGAVRFLAAHPRVAKETITLLPARLAREIGDLAAASRKQRRLSHGSRQRRLKTGEPPPLAELVSHYRAAQRRYAIGPHFLAAIHHVETKFGRVKSNSVAGARGPMQFIPATWRIYGRGGDINDPHDAILAAANLLRDKGAPRSYGRALYSYNPSRLYVGAVQGYARLIARDPYALYFLYCWAP